MKKFHIFFSLFLAIILSACNDDIVKLKSTENAEKKSIMATAFDEPVISPGEIRALAKAEEGANKSKEISAQKDLEVAKLEASKLAEESRKKILIEENKKIIANIFYIKDRFGLCYAVLNTTIYSFREQTVSSFTNVPCSRVGFSDKAEK